MRKKKKKNSGSKRQNRDEIWDSLALEEARDVNSKEESDRAIFRS